MSRWLALALLVAAAAAGAADDPPQGTAATPAPAPAPAPQPAVAEVADRPANVDGFVIEDLKNGVGAVAQPGMVVAVHYTGWLHDPAQPNGRGRKFDSSRERARPFVFPLGAGRVIRGWDEGVAGMQVGGLRRLVIPPELAYGARNVGNGLIPPNSTLLFEVELLGVETLATRPNSK